MLAQVLCPHGADARALSIGMALEALLGPPRRPALGAFLAAA
jgi:hypothetical protein